MDENGIDLRGMAEKGFIRFSIKAEDTPENAAIHTAFKQFAEIEADNNYTMGLRILLKNYESDYRFDAVWRFCESLNDELTLLKTQLAKLQGVPETTMIEKDEGVF